MDIDATDDPCHGQQELPLFDGHLDTYCYLPLFLFRIAVFAILMGRLLGILASSEGSLQPGKTGGAESENEFPASGAAYLVLERKSMLHVGNHPAYARIVDMQLSKSDASVHDPLAARLGRTFAAAPAILLALEAMLLRDSGRERTDGYVVGVDRQGYTFRLGSAHYGVTRLLATGDVPRPRLSRRRRV